MYAKEKKLMIEIGDLLKIEEEKSFSLQQIEKWIFHLNNLDFTCPCVLFGNNAFNCIFQEKQEKCPMCGEQHVFCSKCKRATLWSSIRRTCDSFELTNLAKEHLIEGLNEIIKKRR